MPRAISSPDVMERVPIAPQIPGVAVVQRDHQGSGESTKLLAVTMALAIVGNLSIGLAPFIAHGLVTRSGLTESQAGLCISAEMLGFVLGSAALLAWLFDVRRRRVALAALLLVIGGNLLCLVAGSFPEYAAARLIAGLGCGLTTTAYGDLAATRRPEWNFAILNGASVVVTAALGVIGPWLSDRVGTGSLFLLIALLAAVALPGVRLVSAIAKDVPAAGSVRQFLSLGRSAAVGAAMMLLYFVPLSAYWAYVTQLGFAREADAATVATVVSSGFLVAGFVGGLVAMLPVLRGKHRPVISLAAIGGAASVFVTCAIPSLLAFTVAVYLFIFLWFLALPFLMGVLSALDSSGRLAVGGIIVETVGFAVGPAVGGLLVERQHYLGFGAACAAVFAGAIVCVLTVAPPDVGPGSDQPGSGRLRRAGA